jgi:hypothetical protein
LLSVTEDKDKISKTVIKDKDSMLPVIKDKISCYKECYCYRRHKTAIKELQRQDKECHYHISIVNGNIADKVTVTKTRHSIDKDIA